MLRTRLLQYTHIIHGRRGGVVHAAVVVHRSMVVHSGGVVLHECAGSQPRSRQHGCGRQHHAVTKRPAAAGGSADAEQVKTAENDPARTCR
eukprot:5873520-Pyramimonas_sp.AAC.1